MLLRSNFMKLPGAELLYTDLPWILLFLLILLAFFFSFYPPFTDTKNHPSLVVTDNGDDSSLPGTDSTDKKNHPSLADSVDNSSLPGTDATDRNNRPSLADSVDNGSLPGTDATDTKNHPSLADNVDNSFLTDTDATDRSNRPSLADSVDNSSLRGTDATDRNNRPSLADSVDDSSLPGTDATDTKNHPSLASTDIADNVDSSSVPGTEGIDHDPLQVLDNGDQSSIPEINRIDHDLLLQANDEMDQIFLPTGNDGDQNEVVILVGNKDADKRGFVKSLTRSGAWVHRKIAVDSSKKSCVRTATCTSPARVIVDTTLLKNIKRRSSTMIARRWVSRNCLRRILLGKDVVVVLVVTCKVQNTCKLDVLSKSNCWVDVFFQIFKNHREAIMILVNNEDQEHVPENIKSEIEHFVQKHGLSRKNITYSNLQGGADLEKLIEDGIRVTIIPRDGSPHSTGVKSSNPERETFGPWGPQRMIVFGRTGSGKSTLAQMLTSGKLDGTGATFLTSSGIRGWTTKLQASEGRGWYVVDTPGLGEPKDSSSTAPTAIVAGLIKRYVRREEGTFSHYIYVFRKDRLDMLEARLWKFFVELFGEEVKRQCSVVVSDADKEWVQHNISDLKEIFVGCESFLSAEFPAIDREDEEFERECEVLRTESLSELEDNLASLNRYDMFCKYGRYAKINRRFETNQHYWDFGIERKKRIKFLVVGARMIFESRSICRRPFSELAFVFRKDKLTV